MRRFKITIWILVVIISAVFIVNIVMVVSLYGTIREHHIYRIEQCLRQAVEHTYDSCAGTPDMEVLEEMFRHEMSLFNYEPEEVILLKPGMQADIPNRFWHVEHRIGNQLIYEAYLSPLNKNIWLGMYSTSGITSVVFLISLVLAFGFWYLIYFIGRQRYLDKIKTELIDNITHELKMPIAVADSANESLLEFPAIVQDKQALYYITAARKHLAKLNTLVERILLMSVKKRATLVVKKEPLQLRPFLLSLTDIPIFWQKKSCRFYVDCSEDVVIEADPNLLSEVLSNLIDNSLKYSRENVRVDIKADTHSLSIIDNGIGIPEGSQPFLFERFYRVSRDQHHEESGYGIGLFYVKMIVEKHGWKIDVESREGEGSKFTITFNSKHFKR